MAPNDAPEPMSPNRRFACRVSKREFVKLQACTGAITPKQFTNVFFGQAGSDANDTIIRMVRSYWNLKKQPKKKIVLSRVNSYHGSTMVASSLSGMSYMHELADLPLPGFDYVPQPYWYGEGGNQTPEEFGKSCAKALEDKILKLGAENVGAFIGEPASR